MKLLLAAAVATALLVARDGGYDLVFAPGYIAPDQACASRVFVSGPGAAAWYMDNCQ